MLDHTDDASTQMQKLITATNEVERLTAELIVSGGVLNDAIGRHAENKAKLKLQKEIINSLKIIIRAEGSHL